MNSVVLMHDSGHVTFFRTCMHCGEPTAITEDADKYARWRGGELIQNVWPDLDADTRELYISGTHPSCWEELWGEDDEGDEPPEGWHICDCSPDCGAWEPDEEDTPWVTDDE